MGRSTDINENEHLQYIFNDYKSGIEHGILVANLTYELAKRLKLDERECYELKIAGMMHDIGNLNYQNTYMAEIRVNYQSKR